MDLWHSSAHSCKNKDAGIIAFPAHLEFGLLIGVNCFPHDADLLGDVADTDFGTVLGVLLEILANLWAVFSSEEEEGGKWTLWLWGSSRLNRQT